MSAVRPSPVSRAQIRQVSRSPSLLPVFATSLTSRLSPATGTSSPNEVRPRMIGGSLLNQTRREHQSNPCLVEEDGQQQPQQAHPEQLSNNIVEVRRRLFDPACLGAGQTADIMPGKFSVPGSRQLYKSRVKSTTVCDTSKAKLEASPRSRGVRKSLRCRTDGSTVARASASVPISPGSQKSQDSGFSDSDSQPDEKRTAKLPAPIERGKNKTASALSLRHSKDFMSVSSVNLVGRDCQTSMVNLASESVKQKSRAGHTPKSKRLGNPRSQVLSEHMNTNNKSFIGPLTSSPVCSSHILQCSAVERELDMILERVEQADLNDKTYIHKSADNETTIDFEPSCIEVDENVSQLVLSSPAAVANVSKSAHIESFYKKLATDTQMQVCPATNGRYNESVLCVAQVGSGPARHWLNLQLWEVENECMNMMQSKSVISDMSHLLALSARNARTNVRDIQVKAKCVSREFATLFKELEHTAFEEIPSIVNSIDLAITKFMQECPNSQADKSVSECRMENMTKLKSLISRMSSYVNSCYLIDRTLKIEDLMQVLTSVTQAFNHLVDWMLSEEVKILLSALTPDCDILCLKLALRSVTSVALDGARLCRILVSQGAVDHLLNIAASGCRQLRSQTLRALATVCCVSQGVKAFEQGEGLRLVTNILSDPLSTEDQRSECAGVIAQVTSPSNDTICATKAISQHAEDIVREVTGLAATTDSAECLLMAAAALANLTFLNIGAVRLLQHNGSAGVLCAALTANRHCSIFVKDQTATVLANMASIVECHSDLLRAGALDTLLQLLQEPVAAPTGAEGGSASAAAAERVLQKTAIALSRLCVSRNVSQRVVAAGAVRRLVHLCREPAARGGADGVLVACLTTLRKIASAAGPQSLQQLHALDLVEPRLLESFLICASRTESCV